MIVAKGKMGNAPKARRGASPRAATDSPLRSGGAPCERSDGAHIPHGSSNRRAVGRLRSIVALCAIVCAWTWTGDEALVIRARAEGHASYSHRMEAWGVSGEP